MLLEINMSQNQDVQNVINMIKEMNQVAYPVQVKVTEVKSVYQLPRDFVIDIDDIFKAKIIVISNYQNLLRYGDKVTGYLVQCYDESMYECYKLDGSKITGAFKVSNVVVAYSVDELGREPSTSVKRIIEIADHLDNVKDKDVLYIKSGHEIFVADKYEGLPEFQFTPIFNFKKQFYGGKVNASFLVYKLPMIEISNDNIVDIEQTDFIPLFYSYIRVDKDKLVTRLEYNRITIFYHNDNKYYLHMWSDMIYNHNNKPVEATFHGNSSKEEIVKAFNGSEKVILEPKTLYLFLELHKEEKD